MLKKLLDLAHCLLGQREPIEVNNVAQLHSTDPAVVLAILKRYARKVVARARGGTESRAPGGATEGNSACGIDRQLIQELFDFLGRLPPDLEAEMRAPRAGAHVPRTAAGQAEADALTALDDLVQDVWEHHVGPESQVNGRIRAALAEYEPSRVVDFGAGAGYYACFLAERGCQVTCVEINEVKRRFLMFRASRRAKDRINFHLQPAGYDAALALNVLDHLEDPVTAVDQLSSFLKTGGRLFYIAQFCHDGWHTSDPTVVEATFVRLYRLFREITTVQDAELGLEVLVKRSTPAPVPLGPNGELMLPPPRPLDERDNPLVPVVDKTVVEHRASSDVSLVYSPRFFVETLELPDDTLELLNLCRKRYSTGRIIQKMERRGVAKEETRAGLESLWNYRVISMSMPRRHT